MKKLTISVVCAFLASMISLLAHPGHSHSHSNEKNEKHVHGKNTPHSHGQSGTHATGGMAEHGAHSEENRQAAGGAHGHSHAGEKKSAGPNGGRLIHSVEPHAEFFVTKDRKVQITFVDDEGKAIAPAGQVVTVMTGSRANPLQLAFVEEEGVLISNAALPEGNNFPIVLRISSTIKGIKPVTERFTANLSQCPTCAYAEYACICEGHG